MGPPAGPLRERRPCPGNSVSVQGSAGSAGSAAPPVRHPHRPAGHPPARRKRPGRPQCSSGVSAPGGFPPARVGRAGRAALPFPGNTATLDSFPQQYCDVIFLSLAILRHYIPFPRDTATLYSFPQRYCDVIVKWIVSSG